MEASRHRTLLPHVLALLYGLAIAFSSLQPFAPWLAPSAGTPFWLLAGTPGRWTRFDLLANLLAYIPFGFFVALIPRRRSPIARMALALIVGAAWSFVLESLQMFLPRRDANLIDLLANSAGALVGGLFAATLTRTPALREALSSARQRVFLPGRLGDVGIGLLMLWLVAQSNPGIPVFAISFDADTAVAMAVTLVPAGPDRAATLVEAAESAFQLIGVGLFLALLLRERRYVGGAILLLIGAALLVKGIAATLVLKPAAWEAWLKPGLALGIAVGALVLLSATFLPRAAQVAACAIALLSSLLLPALVLELPSVQAPLTLFNWRYGHLLNFNGLTHTVLLLWPLAAAGWLFLLAGRPDWGRPG